MASFGSFETDREVYSDPTYTVYGAKKGGDPRSEYAIKVFSIEKVGFDTESGLQLDPLIRDIEGSYIARISIQQQAASANVAPVFETGHDERGVWYATKFYARSVNRIISGRVALNRDALAHILRSAAVGALDLRRTCGRSHGDIRPSNVQISRSEKLSEAEVVLSDPLAGGQEEAERFELADLRAIGQILLQLVRQREVSNEEDFLILPILVAPEWTRLFGKDTDRWLALCNRLLDPNLSLDQFTLAQLVAILDQLQPKSGVSPKLLVVAAVALVLLGGGGFAVWHFALKRSQGQTVVITSDPPGATILVDQKMAGQTGKDGLPVKLQKGSHMIEARHDTLRLREQSTNVVVSGTPLKLNFQFAYGSLAITSEPRGATILRDGVAVGKTPADGSPFIISHVAVGVEVKYQLTNEGYTSREIVRTVTAGQRLTVSETLALIGTTGTLEVSSTPDKAKVFWNGNVIIEETPGISGELPQGPITLTAVYRDWGTQSVTFVVQKDKLVPASFSFPYATVTLESDPPGAIVWAGTNNQLGTTPKTLLRPAGTNTFRFEHLGFETTNVTTNLSANARPTVKAFLATTNGTFVLSANLVPVVIRDPGGKEHFYTNERSPLSLTFPPGEYPFTARAAGMADVTATLKVLKRELKTNVFQFDFGTVDFTSQPAGATVSADGGSPQPTPAQFKQRPGVKVSYRILAPDYLPVTNEVVLASRETRPLAVRLAPEPVSVALTSDPAGAQYYYGGAVLSGQRSTYSLPWGTNLVTARHALYPTLEEVTATVVARKGSANAHEFKFKHGTVIFETSPPEATADIFENKKLIARTPTNLFVRPGRVDYQVIYENQTNLVGTNVAEGRQYALRSTFEVKRDYTNSAGMVLVRVSKDLYAGRFEVTHQEYLMLMPSVGIAGRPNEPVVNVKWADALQFCKKLTEKDAASLAKQRLAGWEYSLPTEAEWSLLVGTDTNQITEAVFSYNSQGGKSQDINLDRKSFNKLGIYDLFGSVAEWCLGTNNEPVAMGGSFNSRYSLKLGPEAMLKNVPKTLGATVPGAIDGGVPTIGFRCVIKPKLPQ